MKSTFEYLGGGVTAPPVVTVKDPAETREDFHLRHQADIAAAFEDYPPDPWQ